METTESCNLCERIVITLESKRKVDQLLDLPNTFDETQKKYVWKHHDLMAYALVPQSIFGTTGLVDFYVCIDEDDLDDIDVMEYASEFLQQKVFPAWKDFKDAKLLTPSLTVPIDLECWKLRHAAMDSLK